MMCGLLKLRLRWFKFRNRFIRAYDEGWLPSVDGHEIHYYQIGNPKGEPVIQFHGGPGGSSKVFFACLYNLKKQRIITFDQRGCGLTRSQDPLYKNTMQDTVKDAVRLLKYVGVTEKVVVSGGSFGSTLAILFAETYPERTKRLCVDCIFLGRPKDLDNMSPVTALFYPDALDVVETEAKGKVPDVYYGKLLTSNKLSDNERAIRYYRRLERIAGSGDYDVSFPKTEVTDRDIQKFRIFMHYKVNNMFLKSGQLLKDIGKIAHIPTEIFQNRFDFCCPPNQAWELHKALPKAKFTLVADEGHGGDYMRYMIYLGNKKRKYKD